MRICLDPSIMGLLFCRSHQLKRGSSRCAGKANSIAVADSNCAKFEPQPLEFSVNGDQRIKAAILAGIVADESIFSPDLNVSATPVSVNEDRADWRSVRIADRQTSESVTVH